MTSPATILVQADDPTNVEALLGDLATLGRTVHLTGPYDALLELTATGEDALARIVLAVQALDHVDRTLTLPHVTEEPTP